MAFQMSNIIENKTAVGMLKIRKKAKYDLKYYIVTFSQKVFKVPSCLKFWIFQNWSTR